MMKLPEGAAFVLNRLNEAGYQAYVVGGCVRDGLMGLVPKDWDICTDARPQDMQRIFADQHVVKTGLKHGTLTVMRHHEPFEVTTFRVDGAYTDRRHPDDVTFVTDVREDLARRDFTVNAMAYHPEVGLVDAFGGRADLQAGVIRCVGEPSKRFGEDALRIMRALRFAATYGFTIDSATDAALRSLRQTMTDVAAERLRVELGKLLCGKDCGRILRDYAEVIAQLMPELSPMFGLNQRTPYHRFDVWEHTVRAVENVPPTEVLRLTMLLHDSGKPDCFTVDEQGIGHAYGHQKRSAEIAEAVLNRLKVDRVTFERVVLLVSRHDVLLEGDARLLRRRLNQLGEEALRQLIEVQRADSLAKGTQSPEICEAETETLRQALDAVLADHPCVSLSQLALNGRDLMAMGMKPDAALGQCLNALLGKVIDGEIPNEKAALTAVAKAWTANGVDFPK